MPRAGSSFGSIASGTAPGKQVNRNDKLVASHCSVKTHEPIIPTKALDKKLISDIKLLHFLQRSARQEIQILGF
jgi:hypothetical protein